MAGSDNTKAIKQIHEVLEKSGINNNWTLSDYNRIDRVFESNAENVAN